MGQVLNAKAVIFDRDGVIINTDVLILESIRESLKTFGFELQDEDIKHIIGRSFKVYKTYFEQKWEIDIDEYRRIQNEYYYANLDKAKYFKDTIELIKILYSKNVPMAVTTSAGREGTILILDKVGITNMFKVIVTNENCENLKPDPEPYITTAKKLGIKPKYCVAIEDTALGVESAKKAGMMCIAIPNEHTKHQDFSSADTVVKSAGEIEELIEII
jgi:HAD superfamily hydrolase (TIGR01509 family)